MKNARHLSASLLAFLGLAATAPDAAAGGVVVCNNCSSVAQAAMQGGSGIVIVSDFARKKIWGFRNEFDGETARYLPVPVPIPGAINHSHALTMAAAGATSPDIVMRQGRPAGNAFPFPAGFEGWSAHDVATDTNMRAQFGQALAASYAGATTSSSIWNDLAISLKSLAIDWLSGQHGIHAITINVHWSDGSTSPMAIRRDSISRARPIPGGSFDPEGHRIPDPVVVHDGSPYVGDYRFDATPNLENWINAAHMYGIPINGNQSQRLRCAWDGSRLRCHHY